MKEPKCQRCAKKGYEPSSEPEYCEDCRVEVVALRIKVREYQRSLGLPT